jgi:DNA polymerase III epsilon subunit family exonuclease
MNELKVISTQKAGTIEWNFGDLKQQLQQIVSMYTSLVYTEDSIKDAKKDKASLNKLKKTIEDKRKEIKKIYLAPYLEIETQAKELVQLINEPVEIIDGIIKAFEEREKEAKRRAIKLYFDSKSECLGSLADTIFSSSAFYDLSWENKTTSEKKYQDDIDAKIANIAVDIRNIREYADTEVPALLMEYCTTLSMEKVYEKKAKLDEIRVKCDCETNDTETTDNLEEGYKILKISGSQRHILQILDYMNMLGLTVEELEDGMPVPMKELDTPDFSSFVAFDIETTGTFGAGNGDDPSEITEIGAVKVVNGQIVGYFSELANPGRKIVPRISRLTGITDDMVADKPPVADIIKKFKEFVGNSVLLGHNIKSCDIPYILRAAKKAGVTFENAFFDTYRYARSLQKTQGWDNVRLTYLCEKFGIQQKDAHRASCDAEANVRVYFALKKI